MASIEEQLSGQLKDAMRSKDQRTLNVVRMLKTKHMERRTSAGFTGALDDALWLEVITAYAKQLKKAREEYAALGAKGVDQVTEMDFEIAFCSRFLPEAAGEDEVRSAVVEAVARLAVTDPKQAGKVVGDLMKAHKGKFDAGMVKRVVEETLSKPPV